MRMLTISDFAGRGAGAPAFATHVLPPLLLVGAAALAGLSAGAAGYGAPHVAGAALGTAGAVSVVLLQGRRAG